MTVSILTPNATNYNTAGTVFGAATLHAALADATTTTGILTGATGGMSLEFTPLTLPAGAVVKQLTVIMQDNRDPGFGAFGFANHISAGPHFVSSEQTLTWTTPTTHYGTVLATAGITDAQVDGATVVVVADGTTGTSAALYLLQLAVIYVTIPVVDVTAPTGTLTDDTTPTIYWSRSFDTDGGPQTHYEVVIRDSNDDVVVESTILAGEDTNWASPTNLPDDTYEASVRVAQTVNGALHWSAFNDQTFTIDVPQPAVPTISLIPEASSGRIRIELADPGGGAVSTDFFVVEASYDGGVTFETLRTSLSGLIIPTAGAATVYDNDAPNGVLVSYRAKSTHWYTSATGVITQADSTYVKDTDSWSSDDWWLKHPTRPSLNFSPLIHSQPGRSSAISQGVFHPLGRRMPIVVSDMRQAFSGEVSLRSDDDAARASLDAILADGSPLLLQAPADTYWEDTWMAISQHDRTRPIDTGWSAYTFDNLGWTEVSRPTESLEEGEE